MYIFYFPIRVVDLDTFSVYIYWATPLYIRMCNAAGSISCIWLLHHAMQGPRHASKRTILLTYTTYAMYTIYAINIFGFTLDRYCAQDWRYTLQAILHLQLYVQYISTQTSHIPMSLTIALIASWVTIQYTYILLVPHSLLAYINHAWVFYELLYLNRCSWHMLFRTIAADAFDIPCTYKVGIYAAFACCVIQYIYTSVSLYSQVYYPVSITSNTTYARTRINTLHKFMFHPT